MSSGIPLRVTLLQQNPEWENVPANLALFSGLMSHLAGLTDLVILPEMFATGFSMRPQLFAETMNGSAVNHLKQWAAQTGAAVCGSLMLKEGDRYFNRFVWVEPTGLVKKYDKAHLFRMGEEQLHYTRGTERIIISYKGWRIAPFVCYDLRFPVWMRRSSNFEYDLLLVVANWPARRSLHWKILPQARAIENQSYVITVNRIGTDGNEVDHAGNSQVFSPMGELMFDAGNSAAVKTIELRREEVEQYRKSFPVGLDADSFQLPGLVQR